MFISKLVCDKCGTEASTSDKFCRECGTRGRIDYDRALSGDEFKKLIEKARPEIGVLTCRTCGEKMEGHGMHTCKGLFGKSKFYDDVMRGSTGIYINDTSGKGTRLGARIVCDKCNEYVRVDGHNCKATPDTKI